MLTQIKRTYYKNYYYAINKLLYRTKLVETLVFSSKKFNGLKASRRRMRYEITSSVYDLTHRFESFIIK